MVRALDGADSDEQPWGATEDAHIDGYHLKLTCPAFPEQYDVFKDGVQTGYLRLRWGSFAVHYPDVGDGIIYEADPQGDGFFEKDERESYLRKAVEAIKATRALYE
jgi:hypothetical protein